MVPLGATQRRGPQGREHAQHAQRAPSLISIPTLTFPSLREGVSGSAGLFPWEGHLRKRTQTKMTLWNRDSRSSLTTKPTAEEQGLPRPRLQRKRNGSPRPLRLRAAVLVERRAPGSQTPFRSRGLYRKTHSSRVLQTASMVSLKRTFIKQEFYHLSS